jgi:hypothetical protein
MTATLACVTSGTAIMPGNLPIRNLLEHWSVNISTEIIPAIPALPHHYRDDVIFGMTQDTTVNTAPIMGALAADLTNSGGEVLSPRKAETSRLLATVKRFRELPADWSGKDTVPIDSALSELAERVLLGLSEDIPLPQATPSADGEIGLTWVRQRDRFEALIQPDQHIIWVVGRNGHHVPGGLINLAEHNSLLDLYEALRRFWHDGK